MKLSFFSRIYRHPGAPITLKEVWALAEDELSAIGEATEELIEADKELSRQHQNISWLSQSIVEFIDLLGLPFPKSGRWQHTNYLFFEGLSALRESAVTGLNGSTRASLSILRSSMEMFLFHCWWQERLFLAKTFEPFYDWLEGKKSSPPFKNMLRDNFESFQFPKSASSFDAAYETYRKLCSYVHAPVLMDSITTIRGSNQSDISKSVLNYWMTITQSTLKIILEHLIFHKPQSLFPVNISRKFAFSPPVGMFFDEFNLVPLSAALSEEVIERYREEASGIQIIEDVMNFYHSQPDLSDEQILKNWDQEDDRDFGGDVPEDIQLRWLMVKARMRVTAMAFSYRASKEALYF